MPPLPLGTPTRPPPAFSKQTVRPYCALVRTGQKTALVASANPASPVAFGSGPSGGDQTGGGSGTSAHSPPAIFCTCGFGSVLSFSLAEQNRARAYSVRCSHTM